MSDLNKTEGQASLCYHSFDGGGPEFSVDIADSTVLECERKRRYLRADHERLCGAGYDIIFTFKGLREGETAVKISSFSPIVPPSEEEYLAEVDCGLNVKLTLLGITE